MTHDAKVNIGILILFFVVLSCPIWAGVELSQWKSKCKAVNGVPIVGWYQGIKCLVVLDGKLIEKEIK